MKNKTKASEPITALSTKPLSDIDYLIEQTAPFADSFTARKGELLGYTHKNQRICYLLTEGTISIHRRRDGIVLNTEKAPFIFGVSNQLIHSDSVYIRVVEDAHASRLSLERLNMLIESFGLWQNLARILTYNISRIYEHCIIASQLSTDEIIEHQLKELMQESERVRGSVTAANYILNRTFLSRSSIMRRLTMLRDKGVITLKRGILTSYTQAPRALQSSFDGCGLR